MPVVQTQVPRHRLKDSDTTAKEAKQMRAPRKKKAVNVTIQSIASPNMGKNKKTSKVSAT